MTSSASSAWSVFTVPELLVRTQAIAVHHDRAVARHFGRRRNRLGAEEPGYFQQGQEWLVGRVQYAEESLINAAKLPFTSVYASVKGTAEEVRTFGQETIRSGATTFGQAAVAIGDGIGTAAEQLGTGYGAGAAGLGRGVGEGVEAAGKGAGSGIKGILGFDYGTGLLLVGGAVLLATGGAGYLLSTAGGQQLLVGGGKALGGAGVALAKVL